MGKSRAFKRRGMFNGWFQEIAGDPMAAEEAVKIGALIIALPLIIFMPFDPDKSD